MKLTWRDIVAAVLAVTGGVVVFAKLQSYTWWLIGSWKGALGVLAVLGLGILLTNIVDLVKLADMGSVSELFVWLIAATVVIASLAAATTRLEFIYGAVFVGLGWLAQLAAHGWNSSHSHGTHHYVGAH